MKSYRLIAAAILSCTVGLALPFQAQALKLRVADSFPVGHYIAENLTKPWMDEVTKLTDGKVQFDYYPAEQLGKSKDLLSLTKSGVVDIGYAPPSYVADKLPLAGVGELPEAFHTSCRGTLAYWSMAKPGGMLDKAEFQSNGIRMLLVNVLPPYQVYTAEKKITGIDTFKNLKLRATGKTKELAIERIGAVPIDIPAPETREALSRRTVDGVVYPHSSVQPYGLTPELAYGTQGINFGSFVVSYVISESKWQSLPDDVKQAMRKASHDVIRSGCKIVDKLDSKDKQTLADKGVNFVTMPEKDNAKIRDLLSTIGKEWASDMDSRGKPGTKVLETFRSALAKQKSSSEQETSSQ